MPKTDRSITALMPMRHDSERVKGKNFRPFGDGRPLFEHALSALMDCPLIDRVVINTDSNIVKSICADKYPAVVIHDRPKALRDGDVPMNAIIAKDLEQLDGEYFLQTHSTNPLIGAEHFTNAITTFFDNRPLYDSLFSVTRLQTRLWDQLARPINHNRDILLRTQDLPPVYEENSCFYVFHRNAIQSQGLRIGLRPYLYELDKISATDIDEEVDFLMAEQLFNLRSS